MKVHLLGKIRLKTYHQNGDEHANGEAKEITDRHHDRRDESEVFEHELVLTLAIVESRVRRSHRPKAGE